MSIYVLDWIKEDLKKSGDDLRNYSLLEIKEKLNDYKAQYLTNEEWILWDIICVVISLIDVGK